MFDDLNFRLAKSEELNKVFDVFSSAIHEMESTNIYQWDEVYPDINILKEDIDKRQLYLSEIDEDIASIYVINQTSDQQYENANWQYPDVVHYVVHRLCVSPKYQNRGIAYETMKYIEKHVKSLGAQTIRLDVFSLNPKALKLYKKLGYNNVGLANFRKGDFYLMEKKL